jgi:hypothetical protein
VAPSDQFNPRLLNWFGPQRGRPWGASFIRVVLVAGLGLVVLIAVLTPLGTLGLGWLLPVAAITLATGAVLAAITVADTSAQTRAALRRCRFQICPDCGYALSDLPTPGLCPECGRAYDHQALEFFWDAYLTPPDSPGAGNSDQGRSPTEDSPITRTRADPEGAGSHRSRSKA